MQKEILVPARQYPNLAEVINYHPYHIATFAGFAEVTDELLLRALKGQAELQPSEIWKISKYTGIPISVLTAPKLIMLDKDRPKHQKMVSALVKTSQDIEACSNAGSREASRFMEYGWMRVFELKNTFLDGNGTYGQYLGAKERVSECLLFIENELNRGKRRAL